ncbi:MAG: glycosyl transferase family 1 [Pseudomonadota bacterium]
MRILYLTHDLGDAMTARRVQMLRAGGASVQIAGFRRGDAPIQMINGSEVTDFGRTHNGRFAQRVLAVLRALVLLHRHRALFAQADMILARNLEMLALGVRGRAFSAKPVLVYECLDIHRLMLGTGLISKALRGLERWLCRRAAMVLTSSPAFIREYFTGRIAAPLKLLENKVYTDDAPLPLARVAGPPWRIGWFGVIRCAKSLALLCGLARACPGLVEVVIRGRPAYDQLPDFNEIVAQTPGVTFHGPYQSPQDLAETYGDVHFTWAIDMFEEGLNSAWLLPNRVYEGGLYGAVPLAAHGVETSRFIQQLGIGVTLDEPKDAFLKTYFTQLNAADYHALQAQVAAVGRDAWACSTADCMALVAALAALHNPHGAA